MRCSVAFSLDERLDDSADSLALHVTYHEETVTRKASAGADLGDVPGSLVRVPRLGYDDIFDADVLDVETPAVEEDEVGEGYVLEDEDE